MSGGESSNIESDVQRWLDEHGDVLFRYARLRLWDEASAEDAVQEALLAAMQSNRTGGSSERTWLIGILRHKVLDMIRLDSRSKPVDVEESLRHGKGAFILGLWRRKQTAESVESLNTLDREEVQRAIHIGLDGLPELMRRVIVLKEIDGLNAEEIGKVLDISPTYVWTLVHRAKVRLRETLDQAASQRTQKDHEGSQDD